MNLGSASQTRYIGLMKSASIPPIRVEPQFRDEIEQSLKPGETMASLVEEAVRTEVARRRHQEAFVQRGLAAIERSETQGDAVPADQVIASLKAKLDAARKLQKNRKT